MRTSQIEKTRRELLDQLSNQGRALERADPERASEFNVALRRLVDEMAASFAGRGQLARKDRR